jgi:GTPase
MSSFVDHVRVQLIAGGGGKGAVSFLRTKQVSRGRPDGGDGGHGGSVALVAETGMATLARYVRDRRHRAGDGGSGGRNNRQGANGDEVRLPVPVGTVVKEVGGGEVLADLARV